jgi:hypothetical protein
MRAPKALYRTAPIIFTCELMDCPYCEGSLRALDYINGRKTIQTMQEVLSVAYRPKACVEKGCRAAARPLPSAGWQQLAPKYGTYGYDVIAQIGWERQIGRAPFELIHARLRQRVQLGESTVRYLYHQKYLPLLACHERQHLPALRELAQTSGLLLSLDGLMPEGGEPQLWVIRELQTGWTLRSGWLANQDQATFVAFLRPVAQSGLTIRGILSDKQRGLLPAVATVFPNTPHALCQLHYLQNAAAPVAEADEQMKIALRQGVRTAIGELIRQKDPEKPVELTITGLLPSPLPAASSPSASPQIHAAHEQEQIVQDLLQRVRYLLTLKGRPPFRLAGQEMFVRLQEVVRSVDQLLRHRPEPRLRQLRDGLRQALHALQPACRELNVAAEWLARLAAVLDPARADPQAPARTGAQVRADWEACLADLDQESQTTSRLRLLGAQITKVSQAYAPGLFHTYDIPGLPRTNNGRESEFRELKRRLVSTTGQNGAVKRLLLREGAWELIPAPASLAETITAISQVECPALREEERRVRSHRAGFRLHTRSAQQSQAQLKQLVRRWKALPAQSVPE